MKQNDADWHPFLIIALTHIWYRHFACDIKNPISQFILLCLKISYLLIWSWLIINMRTDIRCAFFNCRFFKWPRYFHPLVPKGTPPQKKILKKTIFQRMFVINVTLYIYTLKRTIFKQKYPKNDFKMAAKWRCHFIPPLAVVSFCWRCLVVAQVSAP